MNKTIKGLIAGTTLALLGACATTTAPPPNDEDSSPEFTEEYIIGFGDNLAINVYRNPDLSVGVLVRPDGKITVPVAGDILVGGKTPEQVSEIIAEALSEYIRDPIVTTTVTGMGSNEFLTRVRVTGAVGAQQSIPYRQGMTVLDVILEAGGVNEFANASKAILYRADGQKINIRLDRILNRGDMSTNYHLRPGDMITVPERAF